MIIKCKHCGHEMTLIGIPAHIEWICEKCFKKTDNYGTNLREQEFHEKEITLP